MRDRNRRQTNVPEPEAPPSPEAQGDGEPAPEVMEDETGQEIAEPARDHASQQLAEQRDKFLRLAAEYDNYRKRTAKERAEWGSRAQAELLGKLLESLDDLQRFAHVDPGSTDAQTLHKGIELVEQKMLKVLGAAGLEVINPVDQTFDPTIHEAITTEPALAPEDDHVVAKVFQPGYRFNGQLLRPARVVVKQWHG
jgi:molecular chaperone GrpE